MLINKIHFINFFKYANKEQNITRINNLLEIYSITTISNKTPRFDDLDLDTYYQDYDLD